MNLLGTDLKSWTVAVEHTKSCENCLAKRPCEEHRKLVDAWHVERESRPIALRWVPIYGEGRKIVGSAADCGPMRAEVMQGRWIIYIIVNPGAQQVAEYDPTPGKTLPDGSAALAPARGHCDTDEEAMRAAELAMASAMVVR